MIIEAVQETTETYPTVRVRDWRIDRLFLPIVAVAVLGSLVLALVG